MDGEINNGRHFTQWAAQFAVASELCKRGYLVSFTMGNATPEADLMVMSPQRRSFLIDVKGQRTNSFWRIRSKDSKEDLFYVLALVPSGKANRFFVLSHAQVNKLMKAYERSGVKYDPRFSGFNPGSAVLYENKWDALPA
jgi:hypothetical protein